MFVFALKIAEKLLLFDNIYDVIAINWKLLQNKQIWIELGRLMIAYDGRLLLLLLKNNDVNRTTAWQICEEN